MRLLLPLAILAALSLPASADDGCTLCYWNAPITDLHYGPVHGYCPEDENPTPAYRVITSAAEWDAFDQAYVVGSPAIAIDWDEELAIAVATNAGWQMALIQDVEVNDQPGLLPSKVHLGWLVDPPGSVAACGEEGGAVHVVKMHRVESVFLFDFDGVIAGVDHSHDIAAGDA